MKPKTMILMVVAIACGLGASYMTSRLLAERSSEPSEQQEKVTILVAEKNLDMGLVIKNPQDLFKEKQINKSDEPRGAIVAFDQLKNRQLRRPLRGGDYVGADDLISQSETGLQGWLPPDHRAVGIRVNPESIAGGFASLPHSKVDIISTVRRGDDKTSYSETLLEDVLVLAADTTTVRDEQSRAMVASVVTVALRPQDVVKVEMAKTLGTLSLTLRKFGEKKADQLAKVTVEQMFNKTATRNDIVEDGGFDSQPPVQVTPVVPNVKTTDVKPVEVKEDGDRHRLIIIEGDRERYQDYLLDKQGRLLNQDVIRSDPRSEIRPESSPSPSPAPQPKD